MKKSIVFIIITAVCFATLEPVSSLIAADVTPPVMTSIRFIIGGLFLLPFALKSLFKNKIKISLKDWMFIVFISIFFVCVSMLLLQYAVLNAKHTGNSPAVVAIIFCSNSAFTLIFSALILKERISIKSVLGILLCLVGIAVCSDFTSGVGGTSFFMALGSAVTMGLYTVLCRKFMVNIPGVIQTAFSFIIGGIILLISVISFGLDVFTTKDVNIDIVAILIYLGAIVTGLGYAAFFKAIELDSPVVASSAFLIKPVLAPFVALIVTNTLISYTVWVSLPLVVVGSILLLYKKKSKT